MVGAVWGLWYFRLLSPEVDESVARIIGESTRPPTVTLMPTAVAIIADPQPQATLVPVCIMPDLIGLTETGAENSVVNLGLRVVKTNEYNTEVGFGLVISQEPAARTRREPCHGEALFVVSLGPPSVADAPPPAATQPPEQAVAATQPPPTATATRELLTLPTPTPDIRLFWDNFETGIRPEWKISGQNFNSANGKLVSNGTFIASIGDHSWRNYRIVFTDWDWNNITVRIRVQDDNNFVALKGVHFSRSWNYNWHKISNGEWLVVPGLGSTAPVKPSFAIEVQGNEYRLVDPKDGNIVARFVDDTVYYGGIIIEASGNFSLGMIEVYPLP